MNSDSYADRLARIRALYVSALSEAVAEADAHVEPVYRMDDGEVATDGALGLPCRADLITRGGEDEGEDGGESKTVDSPFLSQFETESLSIGSMAVHIDPFTWDWVTVDVFGLSDEEASAVLTEWFWDWFDAYDENEETEEGLYGVVHFMSDPELIDNGLRVQIDLGSAPVDALEALFSSLADAGATEVHVGA